MARLAHALEMDILVPTKPNRAKMDFDYQEMDVDTLFEAADVLSIHVPLNDDTQGLLSLKRLMSMPPNSILINTARGGFIDSEQLIYALEKGDLTHAYLDVLDAEPPYQPHPLIEHPSCTVTPHIAWASVNSRSRLMDGVVKNIKSFLEGKVTNSIV